MSSPFPGTPISGLPVAVNLDGTEQIALVQNDTTKRARINQLVVTNSSGTRELLTANRIYYVYTTGSDSNDGLTPATAFRTFNKARDVIDETIDGGGFDVTIQGNNAVHTDNLVVNIAFVGIKSLFIDCAGGTISTTDTALAFSTMPPFGIYLSNMTLTCTGFENNAISIGQDIYVEIDAGVVFGSVGDVHIDMEWPGSTLYVNNNYSITGGGNHHIYLAAAGSQIYCNGRTLTVTGTPAFVSAFAQVAGPSELSVSGSTFSGGATGIRYIARDNGTIVTGGAGPNVFPGSVAGFVTGGGVYDGVGEIFNATTAGLVPASGGTTGYFLQADGVFTAVAAGTGSGLTPINSSSVLANPVNGTALPIAVGLIPNNLTFAGSSMGLDDALVVVTSLTVPTVTATTVNATTVNATTGNFTTVNASAIVARTINATTVNATTINATTANFSSVTSTVAAFSTLNATTASFSTVVAFTANFTTLGATTANFSTMNASVANVTTLNVTTINASTLNVSSIVATTLSVVTLNATTVNASTLNVSSVANITAILSVVGTTLITGRFGVVGTSNFTGITNFLGTTLVTGLVGISGTTNITGILTNVGTANFTGGTFGVQATAVFTGIFGSVGTATFTGTHGIIGTTLVTGLFGVVGTTNITGFLTNVGSAIFTGGTFGVNATAAFTGIFGVVGTSTITGTLNNVGTANFSGGAFNVTSIVSVVGTSNFTGGTFGVNATSNFTGVFGVVGTSLFTSGTFGVVGTALFTSGLFTIIGTAAISVVNATTINATTLNATTINVTTLNVSSIVATTLSVVTLNATTVNASTLNVSSVANITAILSVVGTTLVTGLFGVVGTATFTGTHNVIGTSNFSGGAFNVTSIVSVVGTANFTGGTFGVNATAAFTGVFGAVGTATFTGVHGIVGTTLVTGTFNNVGTANFSGGAFNVTSIVSVVGTATFTGGTFGVNATAAFTGVFGVVGTSLFTSGAFGVVGTALFTGSHNVVGTANFSGGAFNVTSLVSVVGTANFTGGTFGVTATSNFTGIFNVNGTATFTSGAFAVIGTTLFTAARFGEVGTALFTGTFGVVGTSTITGIVSLVGTTNVNGLLAASGTVTVGGPIIGSQSITVNTLYNGGASVLVGLASKSTVADGGVLMQTDPVDGTATVSAQWSVHTDPTPSLRRMNFVCVENNVAYRNITFAEAGGNVGIGTATPATKLDVIGTVGIVGTTNVTGLFSLNGSTIGPIAMTTGPPANPFPGELWWKSDTGIPYIYYTDIDSSQWVVLLEGLPAMRELLTADRTYYVRTDGSDSNTGLVNSAGGAFLTIQHAFDVVAATLDFGSHVVTIQVGTGTYTTGLHVGVTWVGGGTLTVHGDTVTPSNVFLNTSADAFKIDSIVAGVITIGGFKLAVSAGQAINLATAGIVYVDAAMEFGTCSGYHMTANAPGGQLIPFGAYTISGNANIHQGASNDAVFINLSTVTVSGTPAFATAFAIASLGGVLDASSSSYSGSATGTRFIVDDNGVIYTGGGGANFFPGSVAGSGTNSGVSPYGLYQ